MNSRLTFFLHAGIQAQLCRHDIIDVGDIVIAERFIEREPVEQVAREFIARFIGEINSFRDAGDPGVKIISF